jgi:nucleotide-binding universal stress UspA family protein
VETGSFINDLKNVPIVFSEQTRVEDAKAKLVILAHKEIGKFIPVIPQVRAGKPYEEIVTAAKRLEADLIIISTHGRTGLKHALLGSTTERVVRYAPCPVLVVRERERDSVTN